MDASRKAALKDTDYSEGAAFASRSDSFLAAAVTHLFPQYLDADGSICLGKIMALAQAWARHDRAAGARTGAAQAA